MRVPLGRRVMAVLACCVMALGVPLVNGGTASATSGWLIVPGVNPGAGNILYGVAALSTTDTWAVGDYFDGSADQPLIENWNGAAWAQVAAAPPGGNGSFDAIAAISSTDIWAVGDYFDAISGHSLTEHWNGIQWSIVPSPNAGHNGSCLVSITAISTNDVWAVGYTCDNRNAVSMHWNGMQWSNVALAIPPGATSGGLDGVAAAGSLDVWAVGSWVDVNTNYGLSEHWNGTAWKYVPTANPIQVEPLNAVTHLTGPSMLAIGYSQTQYAQVWNGSAWIPVQGATLPPLSDLRAVTASSVAGAWSVGYYIKGTDSVTLTVHAFDGSSSVVPSPNMRTRDNSLLSVSIVPGTQNVWAVGESSSETSNNVLIEYYSP